MKRRPSAASFLCARLARICDRGCRCMTRARERSGNFQQDLSRLIAWRPIFSERNILSGRYFVNRPESRNAARESKHQNPGDGRIAHFPLPDQGDCRKCCGTAQLAGGGGGGGGVGGG